MDKNSRRVVGPWPGDVTRQGRRRGKTGPAPVPRAPSAWSHVLAAAAAAASRHRRRRRPPLHPPSRLPTRSRNSVCKYPLFILLSTLVSTDVTYVSKVIVRLQRAMHRGNNRCRFHLRASSVRRCHHVRCNYKHHTSMLLIFL